MSYVPPFTVTNKIFSLASEIAKALGFLQGMQIDLAPVKLRKDNQIKTIQASLAIEGNTLSLEQVTDILENKRVLGPQKDILEVKNAIKLYRNIAAYDPLKIDFLLAAHKILMAGLIDTNGQWRQDNVGILKAGEVIHIAPKADRVAFLMADLFSFITKNQQISWLLKACIFHYEFEFIHPFQDGNGRIGRLWQQLLLMKEDPLFEFLPVESLIKDNQQEYYNTLSQCDRCGESTLFIEFSLKLILEALEIYKRQYQRSIHHMSSRLMYMQKKKKGTGWFSRKDYLEVHKRISLATASRDLIEGVNQNILEKRGEKNKTLYRFINM